MKKLSPWNGEQLAAQIALQNKHGWDLEEDISWNKGINFDRPFVPLDEKAIAFPGASAEQKIVLSQLMGLIINQTISEMESSLPRLRYLAWEKPLNEYPVNPEMFDLGNIFFEEEKKHAQSFKKYQEKFCEHQGIDEKDLERLIPSALGSHFLKAIIWNAEKGGSAFWWTVAAVEEVSIQIFKRMHKEKSQLDSLFYELHARHTEEEIRHENYAFLMLEVAQARQQGLRQKIFQRTDLLFSEIVSVPWVLIELSKIQRVKEFDCKKPFFKILKSCLPLFESMSKRELINCLFSSAPYVSWMINPRLRKNHQIPALKQKALSL